MITDDTTRRREDARARARRPRGFLESQGADGIGWLASQDPLQRDAYRASRASLARPDVEAEVLVIRETDRQRPLTRPGVVPPLGSDSELR